MLILHNGNEYNVTDKFTLGQLMKYGAVLVEESKTITEDIVFVEESIDKKINNSRKYTARK